MSSHAQYDTLIFLKPTQGDNVCRNKSVDYMLHFLMIIWPEIHWLFFFSFTTTISFNSPNSERNNSLFCHPPFLEAGIFAALPGQNWPVFLWATRLYFLPGFCSNAGCCRSSLCSSLSSDRPPPHGASPPHTAGLHTITQIFCHYPINMVILDEKILSSLGEKKGCCWLCLLVCLCRLMQKQLDRFTWKS